MLTDIKHYVFLTFHPTNSARLFGEQIMIVDFLDAAGFVEKESLDGLDGAVVIIRGVDNKEYLKEINEALGRLFWCVVIVTGNEDSSDFYKGIKHPRMALYLQTPKQGDTADVFLGIGYPTRIEVPTVDKKYNWCFMGQINSPQRRELIRQARQMNNGLLIESPHFAGGIPPQEYYLGLTASRVAFCPAAVATPDSFRIYEALECGVVPLLDDKTAAYFDFVWDVNPLPRLKGRSYSEALDAVLREINGLTVLCTDWWNTTCKSMVHRLDAYPKILKQFQA